MPDSDRPEKLDYVRGDATGLDIPAHPAALRAVGENFLTQALQVFGALAPGNCIIRITRCEPCPGGSTGQKLRSEEHTSELQSLMRISYAVFCLKKKTNKTKNSNASPHIQHLYRTVYPYNTS